jgi:integral membrane protein (TIGR00529 family)
MPALAKILIVFAGMLLAARLRLQLGIALVLGGLTLNFWAGLPAAQAAANLGQALHDPDLWLLLVITLLIELCRFVTEGRNSRELLAAVQRWGGRHGRAATLIGLPAMIGLIPMAAGALLSAPFVRQASEGTAHSAEWKSAVNYWFRHVWEYWWPLYPGVIVSMSILGIDTLRFISVQWLYTPVALAVGYFFLIRPHAAGLAQVTVPAEGSNRRALFVMLPLLVVVASMCLLPMPLRLLLPSVSASNRRLIAVMLGLAIGLAYIFVDERRSRQSGQAPGTGRRMFSTLFERNSVSIMITLAGGLLFKSLLERSGLVPQASRDLMAAGVPVVATVAALPCMAGAVTGMSVGFAGTAFPLVAGLMNAPEADLTPLATLVLAYGFGYVGMMLSPVHLCLLVTRDFFKASLWPVYRHFLPCIATVAAYSLLAHLVLRRLGL